jgi:hypothetical protein
MPLNFANSGDAVNRSALMGGDSSASRRALALILHLQFPGELLVSPKPVKPCTINAQGDWVGDIEVLVIHQRRGISLAGSIE